MLLYNPAVQLVHCAAPAALYLPGPQSAQLLALALEYDPATHVVQLVDPLADANVPGVHARQDASDAPPSAVEKVPLGQEVQGAASVLAVAELYVPAAHWVQVADPMDE